MLAIYFGMDGSGPGERLTMKQQVERTVVDTIVGPLTIGGDTTHIHFVAFSGEEKAERSITGAPLSPVLKEACSQLEYYFKGDRCAFDLPLRMAGTEFQKRVWRALREIEFGHVLSYGELARHLGNPHLARAVGQAANKNPLPIIIPCHRLVGSGGWLGGFAPGVELKKVLLEHEGVHSPHQHG